MSKFKYVKLDETRFFNDRVRSLLCEKSKIWAVYAFDSNEQVNCCEFTPSYWMEYLGFSVEYAEEISEKQIGDVESEIQNIFSLDDKSDYYQCRIIDALAKDIPTKNDLVTMEDVIEQFQTNPWMI